MPKAGGPGNFPGERKKKKFFFLAEIKRIGKLRQDRDLDGED